MFSVSERSAVGYKSWFGTPGIARAALRSWMFQIPRNARRTSAVPLIRSFDFPPAKSSLFDASRKKPVKAVQESILLS
jgi:hypothetical protein